MSVRRNTANRLTLIRTCATCGHVFPTTAASPFMRQVPRDGKRQATAYYCSESCKNASYIHRFDGKSWQRRQEREAMRDTTEKNRRYYATHAEQERERQRARYWADPESAREDVRFQRRKMAVRA